MLKLGGTILARLKSICCRGTDISPELLSIVKDVLNVPHCRTLADDDVVTIDDRSWVDDPIVVKLVVGAKATVLGLSEVRPLKTFVFLLGVGVGTEES